VSTGIIASLHIRTDDADEVIALMDSLARGAACVLAASNGWVSILDQTAHTQGVEELRRLVSALSAAAETTVVGLIARRGASGVLIYRAGVPAGVATTDADAIGPTPEELVAADPVDAILALCVPGTDRQAVAEVLLDERADEIERLTEIASLLRIDPTRIAQDFLQVIAASPPGLRLIGAPVAPEMAPEPLPAEQAGPRSLEMYATAVAMIAKAGELYSEMSDQLGDDPTPEMMKLFEVGRRQYFDQLDEMLQDAAYPGAPGIRDLADAATDGHEARAALLAKRTPSAMPALALHVVRTGNASLLREVLRRGVSTETADADQHTLLMLACMTGHEGCADVLLSAGAQVAACDSMGHTPLLHAARHSPVDVLRHLIAAGADPHATAPGGVGALDLARYNPDQARILALLRTLGVGK
jgi:hypothetical protein